ncbi:hypothetical protein Dsin_012083 [Dipteronia sinensis]|uniref:Reverse transcriptase n=1 Tax=Dipteronia sinensis TaxID=43782 RepID=A0AAE0AHC8_9ROSI|nr:hypothetical protein Dsin_012083 [Dipteronia sinensis]
MGCVMIVVFGRHVNVICKHWYLSILMACYALLRLFYDDIEMVMGSIQERLSPRNRDYLDKLFTAEEVRKAIFDMYLTKALGLDGLPAFFYQKFWPTVGKNVTNVCLGCLNERGSLEEVNGTLITLIPKVQQPECISEFRPISLCNVGYKIVVKALANRFRLVLGEVISEAHSAFILGHLILDNVINGFECIHVLRKRK